MRHRFASPDPLFFTFCALGTIALYFIGGGVNGLWVIGWSLSNPTHNPLLGFSCLGFFPPRDCLNFCWTGMCMNVCVGVVTNKRMMAWKKSMIKMIPVKKCWIVLNLWSWWVECVGSKCGMIRIDLTSWLKLKTWTGQFDNLIMKQGAKSVTR